MATKRPGAKKATKKTPAKKPKVARKKSRKLRLYEHEGWPLQLALERRVTPGHADIN